VAAQGNSPLVNYAPPPVPPAFTLVSRLDDGNVLLGGTGRANDSFRLLATTNLGLPLPQWAQLSSGSFSASGQLPCTDLLGTNFLQRFYRVVTP
jgi:hypothetical protein